ncbi:hypothetical protein HZY88_09165 [Aerococcaceae bacterium DSM 111176]|nr:hypothetical protein [Aerococcaceae bacterium DSM 111176]
MQSTILFLVNHEVVIYNFRKEIVEAFLEVGHRVVISSPPGEKIDELVSVGCIHENVTINRHGKNITEDLSLMRQYDNLFAKVKPDIIFSKD